MDGFRHILSQQAISTRPKRCFQQPRIPICDIKDIKFSQNLVFFSEPEYRAIWYISKILINISGTKQAIPE